MELVIGLTPGWVMSEIVSSDIPGLAKNRVVGVGDDVPRKWMGQFIYAREFNNPIIYQNNNRFRFYHVSEIISVQEEI